jgi:hypothetical protein
VRGVHQEATLCVEIVTIYGACERVRAERTRKGRRMPQCRTTVSGRTSRSCLDSLSVCLP